MFVLDFSSFVWVFSLCTCTLFIVVDCIVVTVLFVIVVVAIVVVIFALVFVVNVVVVVVVVVVVHVAIATSPFPWSMWKVQWSCAYSHERNLSFISLLYQVEFALPEQYKSTWNGKTFVTTTTESLG